MLPLKVAEKAESFDESKRGLANSGEIAGDGKTKSLLDARRFLVGAKKTDKQRLLCM